MVHEMKLSEAMRIGSKMHPQIQGNYFECDDTNTVTGTCAMGASGFGRGIEIDCDDDYLDYLDKLFDLELPDDIQLPIDPPPYGRTLGKVIEHMNDTHLWTREAIADWLESIGY